ncbi:prostaglandin E receptor 1c (subtype EP1) [Anguilla rostrata]|uniref:prostaglandin E receptor 1c (subtype EP1) n=1 Tax=Anguilla rostrata TaxID=7938 RepID=UPI0030D15975
MAYETIPSSPLSSLHPSSSSSSALPDPSLLLPSVRNASAPSPELPEPAAPGMTCVTMTLGAVSNLAALAILSRSSARRRRRPKSPFLLLTGALLLTDLAGHLIPGALALHLHLERGQRWGLGEGRGWAEPGAGLCRLFGACMVFFGLCPLLLGGAMAVERCLGITRPLLHAAVATVSHARRAAALLASLALLLALLPLVAVGSYTPQFPGTWCFLPVHRPPTAADAGLALAFSSLGLAALALSLFCNSLSGLALLQARLASRGAQKAFLTGAGRGQHGVTGRPAFPSPVRSLDVEMMAQLAGITVVSCVCWTPFLVLVSASVGRFHGGSGPSGPGQGPRPYERQVLLGLRMASWNQILDPWVYILLRRAVLRRLCGLLQPQRPSITHSSSSCADWPGPDACLRSTKR